MKYKINKRVLKGLTTLGDDLPCFYKDLYRILNNADFESQSVLISHLLREIKCGVMDLAGPRSGQYKTSIEVENKGNIASLMASLDYQGVERETYIMLTKLNDLDSNAHRADGTVRNVDEIINDLKIMENILINLLGTNNRQDRRIDAVLKNEVLNDVQVNRLKFLIRNKFLYQSLFQKLKHVKWLPILITQKIIIPSDNPSPTESTTHKGYYRIPTWEILDYLEHTSKVLKSNLNKEIFRYLAEFILSVIRYRKTDGSRIENNITDYKLISILSNFPPGEIKSEHINFIETALNSKWNRVIDDLVAKELVPKLIKDKDKKNLIELLDVIFKYRNQKDSLSSGRVISIIDHYWLNDIIENYGQNISQICGIDGAKVLLKKIQEICVKQENKFNLLSIELSNTRVDRNYEDLIFELTTTILANSDIEDLRKLLPTLLRKGRHLVYTAIALKIMQSRFQELKETFWNKLFRGDFDNWILKPYLFDLFGYNAENLTSEEITNFINWLENRKFKKETKEGIAYAKKEWLSALVNSKDERISELYDKFDSIGPGELSIPGKNIYISGLHTVHDSSIISKEELLEMSNEKIVELIMSFKEKSLFEGPTRYGLATQFQKAIEENPRKFLGNLTPFLNLDYEFINYLFGSLESKVEQMDESDTLSLINFVEKLINTNNSETVFLKLGKGTGDLVKELIYKKFNLIIGHKEKIEGLLFTLLNSSSLKRISGDPLTESLNNLRGIMLDALLNYQLKFADLQRKENNKELWIDSVKSYIELNLKNYKDDDSLQFALGRFIIYIYFNVDKEWALSKIKDIYFCGDGKLNSIATIGYISMPNIYEESFKLILDLGVYSSALQVDLNMGASTNDHNDRLIQHIGVAYLHDWIKLDGTIISEIIRLKNEKSISSLISFLRQVKNELKKSDFKKVIALWRYIDDKIGNSDRIWHLVELIEYLDEITPTYQKWLEHIVTHIGEGRPSWILIEELERLVTISPKQVGEIFIKLLRADSETYPAYPKETIINIVRKLYKNDCKAEADLICELYLEKGDFFLRDVYDEYNSN